MASRIAGITIELNGDSTKLQTALKSVNTEIKNTESQLRDVNKLLKLDPGNTELIAQKHKLLAQAVEETKNKLETLKTAQQQADEALKNGTITQEQYPIVLIIAAIAALVAAFIYLWNTNEDFRQFWIDLWENIKEVAIACWEAISSFLKISSPRLSLQYKPS